MALGPPKMENEAKWGVRIVLKTVRAHAVAFFEVQMEHPIGAVIHANRAITERLASYTVTIVDARPELIGPKTTQENVGTCAALLWRGRPLLATAGHNVKGAKADELRFMPRSAPSLDRTSRSERQSMPIAQIVICDWEDLALIELASVDCLRDVQFFAQLSAESTTPPYGTELDLVGSPVRTATLVNEVADGLGNLAKNLSIQVSAISSSICEDDSSFRYLSGYDPHRHFLAKFESAKYSFHPHGFSGCGVWYYRLPSAPIWQANALLAGIETHYYEKSSLLKCVRVEELVKFLVETYGDDNAHR